MSEHAPSPTKSNRVITISAQSRLESAGLSAGLVIALVLLLLLLLLVLIDVACFFLNECGVLMFCCVNFFGRAPPDARKHREVAVEQGGR